MSSHAKVGAQVEAAPRKAASVSAARSPRLQRKCACAGGGSGCESCKKKPQEMLQRKAMPGAPAVAAPAPVAAKAAASAAAKASPLPSATASALAPKVPAPTKPKSPVEPTAVSAPGGSRPAVEPGAKPAPPKPSSPGEAMPKTVAPSVTKPESKTPGKEKGAAAGKPVEPSNLPPTVKRVLETPGQPLDPVVRTGMEARFGRSFRDVRIHTDALAAQSARDVYAHAYTVGEHIVFDSGQYRPETAEGRQLLAHELAHTVQQHGLQRSSDDVLASDGSSEYHHLEREAESVSRAVMSREAPEIGAPRAAGLASRPILSRATKKTDSPTATSKPPVKQAEKKKNWQEPDEKLKAAGVLQYALPDAGATSGIVAVQMADALSLPAQKGPVQDIWQKRADAGALEAIIVAGEDVPRTRAGLKQERPPTTTLREIWRAKVKWASANADSNWKAAGGDKEDFSKPQAGGKTCQVDHILELQFGGDNVPANMQMLDGAENEQSGRDIFKALKKTADTISAALQDNDATRELGKRADILIHYDKVNQPDPTCKSCCGVEKVATDAVANPEVAKQKNIKVLGAGESIGGQKGKAYPIQSASIPAVIFVTDDSQKEIPLSDSDIPENKFAATIIAGLILKKWNRTGKGGGTIDAVIDAGEKGRLPVALTKGDPVVLNRANDAVGTLTFAKGAGLIPFTFGPLSPGAFTHLQIAADGSLSGTGWIKPTFFLPQLDIQFDKEKFAVSKEIPKDKLKLPIPGLKITEAKIALQIAPAFKPEGTVAFLLEAGTKKILDGSITLSADTNGLVAVGKVHAFLPGVDNAEGEIKLQNKQWTGMITIETTQLKSKLKYIKDGSVVVKFSDSGMFAEGTVNLDIPLTKGVEAKLSYDSSKKRWAFKGKGAFQIPRLKEAELEIEYDGEHLSGGTGPAGVAFEFHGLNGVVHVRYKDEKFSGSGKLTIDKGKVHGSLEVTMHPGDPEPKFSGKGEVSYQLSPNLIAKAGIEIDEKEHVRLLGALEFPQPIPLFKPIEGNYKFFELGVSIPIPGASIGPIGLKARIDGSLSAGYKLGPGELRNTKLEAAFNPLDEKPDVDVVLTSTLFIGASAYISGSIAGSIVVDVGIASVSGGLKITATASLEGHVASQVTIHYSKSRLEVDANFELLVGLALILALDAFVKAKAGIGPFSVETEKTWNLATYKYETGLQFGMKLKNPIHYASDQPMKLPSFDDIEWTVPKDINAGDVLSKIFSSSNSKEQGAS